MKLVWTLTISLGVAMSLAACSGGSEGQTEPPPSPAPATSPPVTPTPQPVDPEVELGQEAFMQVCAQCHGENAQGHANDLDAPALDSTEHAIEHPDQQIHDWIVNGKLGLGRQMPPYGDQLTDDDVHAVLAYLHTLWTPEQLAVQQDITSRWPATPEPGREP